MLKVEKDSLMHCEKEMNLKLESSEVSRRAAAVADARIAELELDLRECMTESNLFETMLEEALQESSITTI